MDTLIRPSAPETLEVRSEAFRSLEMCETLEGTEP